MFQNTFPGTEAVNSLINDTEDERDHRLGRRAVAETPDREITLGTTMILLIFFALAVQDAAVFGFGFSMGSKHTGSTSTTASAPASSLSFGGFKPAPGNPLGSAAAIKPPVEDSTPTPLATPPPVRSTPAPIERVEVAPDEPPVPSKPLTAAPAATAAATLPIAPTVAPGPGTFVVQVAALSRQEDADMIGTTLRRRGYLVNIRTDADRLLHVQVGPFATRKDAETMKARLLADGFNAYIK